MSSLVGTKSLGGGQNLVNGDINATSSNDTASRAILNSGEICASACNVSSRRATSSQDGVLNASTSTCGNVIDGLTVDDGGKGSKDESELHLEESVLRDCLIGRLL